MIFTDRFVYLHQPKTGGTFVTSVLFRLHDYRWSRGEVPAEPAVVEPGAPHQVRDVRLRPPKHGGRSAIPRKQRHKPVVATVRNPYDLYVSQYEFAWWKRPEYRRSFARVRSFDDFVLTAGEEWGSLTEQFLRFYDGRTDDVRFLMTEHLNESLHGFLAEMGYAAEGIAFVRGLERILPGGKGRDPAQRWEAYYTPELKQLVRTREDALFAMFPQYDV